MLVSLPDQGLYYRGLLVLIRRDRTITDDERRLMIQVGGLLGFEQEFCASAIDEILENTYIPDDPPRFSRPEVAQCFIRDGIRIAGVDGPIDNTERAWLESVAAANGIPPSWVHSVLADAGALAPLTDAGQLEAARFRWR